jgi:hypothetical protein
MAWRITFVERRQRFKMHRQRHYTTPISLHRVARQKIAPLKTGELYLHLPHAQYWLQPEAQAVATLAKCHCNPCFHSGAESKSG